MIMNKEELYKKALSNIHRYSLLNEIFAIRDERFPKEQQDYMLCVNGYIGIDTLNRYVRNIDELVEYQNIDTIENLKEKDEEIERLKKDLINLLRIIDKNCDDLEGTEEEFDSLDRAEDLLKELKEGK